MELTQTAPVKPAHNLFSAMPKRSNILVLAGVKVMDIASAYTFSSCTDAPREQYPTMPRHYIGPDSHPNSIDRVCHTCDLMCDSWPRFIPENSRILDGRVISDCVGVFCHEVCAIAHVNLVYNESRRWELIHRIMEIRRDFHPTDVNVVFDPAAAPKWRMSRYAGNGGMTPAQWREVSRKGIPLGDTDITSYSSDAYSKMKSTQRPVVRGYK